MPYHTLMKIVDEDVEWERRLNSVDRLHSAIQGQTFFSLHKHIPARGGKQLFSDYTHVKSLPVICSVVESFCKISNSSHALCFEPSIASITEIFRKLCQAGADINATSQSVYYCTPLELAILYMNFNLTKALVEAGADVNHVRHGALIGRRFDDTTLSMAANQGPEFVQLLMTRTIRIRDEDDSAGPFTPLHYAIHKSTPEVLNLLMDIYEQNNRVFPWSTVMLRLCTHVGSCYKGLAVTVLGRGYPATEALQEIFTRALGNQWVDVLRLLIIQNPQIVHKDWMFGLHISQALISPQHQRFVAWFLRLQSVPLPLQLLCKLHIRRQLGPKPEALIYKLPLPDGMKDYLQLTNTL